MPRCSSKRRVPKGTADQEAGEIGKLKRSVKKETTDPAFYHDMKGDSQSPVVVFAHGAGAPSTSEWMLRWKEMLGRALNAVEVITFDYPFFSHGKRRVPPKADNLLDYHLDIVRKAISEHLGHPLILVGKSMGSRVSCMVANTEGVEASAVVCLGYPLKGMNGAIRDDILLQLMAPIMFVQGSKDCMCPLNQLDVVRKKMKALTELHVLDGGDHSLKVGKQALKLNGSTQEHLEEDALESIRKFINDVLQAQ